MSLPPVLLLDLDDTILDDTGGRDRCWRQACLDAAARYPELDAERLQAEVEAVRDWFWRDPERHAVWRLRMREAWVEIAREALVQLGREDSQVASFIGERHFELRNEALMPLPGAIDTLERMRVLGTTLGLITNGGSEGQRAKIERFSLAVHFDYIGIEGEVGYGKPHRVAYETALRRLDVGPSDAWMVGDNLEWDVAEAQAAGITGIWLDGGDGLPAHSTVTPDRIVRAISELLPA